MKNLSYTLLITSLFLNYSYTQVDTVLYEDFQFDVVTVLDSMSSGTDTSWINVDEDGLEPQFGGATNARWYHGEFFVNALDSMTGQTNFVATSLSFLSGFLEGNRNWLILPPIEVSDGSFMLHWESSPSQLPRYMDGYTVLLSTTGNLLTDFTDTLFNAASMLAITGDGQSTDFSNFTFTPGYLHANAATIPEYFIEGTSIHSGLLEPHSVDLSAYEGETVYIAFLHNSDDDDRLAIDDVLITKTGSSSTDELQIGINELLLYPNPVDHQLIASYELKQQDDVIMSITGLNGQVIKSTYLRQQTQGKHIIKIGLSDLTSGHYLLVMKTLTGQTSQKFFKK